MPSLTIFHYIFICLAVFIAGFVDAIAGGGGLITMPAYLLIGLPSHSIIGTNKLSSSMGTIVSTAEYIRKGFVNWKNGIFCILFTFTGAFLGSNLALLIPENVFEIIMIVLLPIIAIYVYTHKTIENTKPPYTQPDCRHNKNHQPDIRLNFACSFRLQRKNHLDSRPHRRSLFNRRKFFRSKDFR